MADIAKSEPPINSMTITAMPSRFARSDCVIHFLGCEAASDLLFAAFNLLWHAVFTDRFMNRIRTNRSAKNMASSRRRASQGRQITPPDALGVATRLAARRLREASIPLEPLLKSAGLSVYQIDTKEMRIAVDSQITFLELAANALQDPLLGFSLARDADLREMGLLHYAAGASATLADALHRFERYSSIVNEGVVLKCVKAGDLTIEFGYAGVPRHADQQQMEFVVTTGIRSCRDLTGRDLKPTAVHFVHRRSKKPSELENYFGCRIIFGAEADRISFDKKAGQLPVVRADPYLGEILLHYCEQALANRRANSSSLQSRIENAIAPVLPHGEARFDEIAQKLGMSRRSLARRLKADGLTFSGILQQLRTDLTTRYLSEANLSISQIAWLVGFQSVGAFSHSCKRWKGMSPKALRDRLLKSNERSFATKDLA
jgi:AraC-like DNA-binding protein